MPVISGANFAALVNNATVIREANLGHSNRVLPSPPHSFGYRTISAGKSETEAASAALRLAGVKEKLLKSTSSMPDPCRS